MSLGLTPAMSELSWFGVEVTVSSPRSDAGHAHA